MVFLVIASVIMLIGAIFYNPIRRKMNGIIGVGGSYFILFGVMGLIMGIGGLIARLFGNGEKPIYESLLLLAIAGAAAWYTIRIMLTRCETKMQRILLPVAGCMIGLGFIWRLLLSMLLNIPMENNSSSEPQYPTTIRRGSDGEIFHLTSSLNPVEYTCRRTGERVQFLSAVLEDGLPADWYAE